MFNDYVHVPLYTYAILVTYSVDIEDFEGLFCTHTSP